MTKHTKGPWVIIHRSQSYIDIVGGERPADGLPTSRPGEIAYERVCRVHNHAPGPANAALILALPDLLAACEAYCYGRKDTRECEAMMRAAIQKATAEETTEC